MERINRLSRKTIGLTAAAFAVSVAIHVSGVLSAFELKAYDMLSRNLNPVATSDKVVLVEVDQQSLDSLSREGITWPWPRQVYAPLIEYLSEADAVFVDIIFSEASSYGQEDDAVFAQAVKKAANVYLALFLTKQRKSLSAADKALLDRVAVKEKAPAVSRFVSAVVPIDALKDAAQGGGNVTIPPDEDGVYRRVPLAFGFNSVAMPHFIVNYLMRSGMVTVRKGAFYAKDVRIPLADRKMLVRYYRGDTPFTTFSAAGIIRAYLDSSAGKTPAVRKDFFKGKKVFIGLTAAGLYDLKPTAVSSISTGVLVHAMTLENILNGDFIRPVPSPYLFFLIFLICVSVCYAVAKHHSIYRNLSYFVLSFLLLLGIEALFFIKGFYMNTTSPLAALTMSFIIVTAYSYATEGKERVFIRKTFSRYMDKQIVDYVLKNPSLIKPGGQKKRVSVFFTDIAGFTSISERLPVEETARILHTILNEFTEVIISNSGVIDKYIGDCIMAFWGAPLETDRDEINACRAALSCMEALVRINAKFRADGLSEIAMRIGIHSGDAIAGNLGSDRLFDYTVIGDTVNLASRLESVNKVFRTRIIISEFTLERTGDLFTVRELGLIEVKGKSIPVRIFELIGESSAVDTAGREKLRLYSEGLRLYRAGKWDEAAGQFRDLLGEYPSDGPSEFYLQRCEHLKADPDLTGNWDVVKMSTK
jgi:adenylate cyclase